MYCTIIPRCDYCDSCANLSLNLGYFWVNKVRKGYVPTSVGKVFFCPFPPTKCSNTVRAGISPTSSEFYPVTFTLKSINQSKRLSATAHFCIPTYLLPRRSAEVLCTVTHPLQHVSV